MSTALLHYGANERKHAMLKKLGGEAVLREATDRFYDRQVHDERLLKFFRGADLTILKWHQFNLMSIAFTAVPVNFDVEHLILNRHERLFDEGLDERYFAIVMEHFVTTLKDLNVDPEVIDDATTVIMPSRKIFERGAEDAKKRLHDLNRQRLVTQITLGFAIGTVLFLALTRNSRKARH